MYESGSEFGGFFFLGELVGIAGYTSKDCWAAGIASHRIIVRGGEQIQREIEKEMITLVRNCWLSIASPICILQVSNTLLGRRRSTWEIVGTNFFMACKSSKYQNQQVSLVWQPPWRRSRRRRRRRRRKKMENLVQSTLTHKFICCVFIDSIFSLVTFSWLISSLQIFFKKKKKTSWDSEIWGRIWAATELQFSKIWGGGFCWVLQCLFWQQGGAAGMYILSSLSLSLSLSFSLSLSLSLSLILHFFFVYKAWSLVEL